MRNVSFDEDRSQVRARHAPHVRASPRNNAIGILRLGGWTNIAAALRHHARDADRAVTRSLTCRYPTFPGHWPVDPAPARMTSGESLDPDAILTTTPGKNPDSGHTGQDHERSRLADDGRCDACPSHRASACCSHDPAPLYCQPSGQIYKGSPVMTRAPWRRLLSFVAQSILTTLAPLATIPAITHAAGASGFAAIAIGQSIGSGLSVITGLGWGLTGASIVASAQKRGDAVPDIGLDSLLARTICAVPLSSAAAALAYALTSTYSVAAALSAVSGTLLGLSFSWYFTGLGQSNMIAYFETAPQVVTALTSAGLIYAGVGVWILPTLSTVSILATRAVIAFRLARSRSNSYKAGARASLHNLRGQLRLTLATMSQALYTSFTVALVSAISPQAVPLFAAGYRVLTLARNLILPVRNAFQSWVVHDEDNGPGSHSRQASLITTIFGALLSVGVLATLPFVDRVLFSGAITFNLKTSVLVAGPLTAVAVSTSCVFYYLLPANNQKTVERSLHAGAAIGSPTILVLAYAFGANGAFVALTCTEIAVALYVLGSTYRLLRPRRS